MSDKHRITRRPIKVLLRVKACLSRLCTYRILITRQTGEMRLAVFDKARNLSVDSAVSVFSRDGKTVALYSIRQPRISIIPTGQHTSRVLLYRSSGRFGLSIFYYRDNPTQVYFGNGHELVGVQRDDIVHVRKALRRFTQNAKSDLSRKPGKPFGEYEAPP